MDKTTLKKGQPLHKVCSENVEIPTLIQDNNNTEVSLQWFGGSEYFDLSGMQFSFPLNTNLEAFYFHPEKFEIIMIGPVKNWPNPEAIPGLIEDLGGEDVIIIYFISSEIGVDDGNGQIIPAAGILPLTILLADENCGIIKPVEFFNDMVRKEAIKKLID
ncbi:hypothetical protein COB64_02230 [Candidatus Wolfebacteria bacterium]|nr:MAG: hypothetical protein COB64_02230 [Candidatus Wolfebacteria bacterium]